MNIEGEAENIVRACEIKRYSDIDRGITIEGDLLKVTRDQFPVARAPLVPGPEEPGTPQIVAEVDLGPAEAQTVVGGHVGPTGGIHPDEDLLTRDRSLLNAKGRIVELGRVGRRKVVEDGGSIGRDESEILTAVVETEIGMKFLTGNGAVLPGGKDHQEPPGEENGVIGDTPLCRVVRIVGEKMPSKIVGCGIGIVEFEPVLPFAVLISQT